MIRRMILSVIMSSLGIWGVTQIIPDFLIIEGGIIYYVIPGILLGLLNTLAKPILKLLSLPLIILTGGLFSIVINAFIIFVVEFVIQQIVIGDLETAINLFDVRGGVFAYIVTGFVVAVMNAFTHWLLKK